MKFWILAQLLIFAQFWKFEIFTQFWKFEILREKVFSWFFEHFGTHKSKTKLSNINFQQYVRPKFDKTPKTSLAHSKQRESAQSQSSSLHLINPLYSVSPSIASPIVPDSTQSRAPLSSTQARAAPPPPQTSSANSSRSQDIFRVEHAPTSPIHQRQRSHDRSLVTKAVPVKIPSVPERVNYVNPFEYWTSRNSGYSRFRWEIVFFLIFVLSLTHCSKSNPIYLFPDNKIKTTLSSKFFNLKIKAEHTMFYFFSPRSVKYFQKKNLLRF